MTPVFAYSPGVLFVKILLSGVPLAGVFLTPSPTRAEPEKKKKENTSKMLRDENQRTKKKNRVKTRN